MGELSMIRKLDNLGRIVIPMELRELAKIECGQNLELILKENELILRRFAPECIFCGSMESLTTYEGKPICRACCRKIGRA